MKFAKFITTTLAAISISATSAKAEAPASFVACAACHQATGQGIPGVFPPLAGSEWVLGPVENLIKIQLRGLQGEITVKGVKYNSVMPPNAAMSDDQIAEVLATAPKEEPKVDTPAGPVAPDLKTGEFKEIKEVDSGLPLFVYGFFALCAAPVAISAVSKS